jgi:hypothetical protein
MWHPSNPTCWVVWCVDNDELSGGGKSSCQLLPGYGPVWGLELHRDQLRTSGLTHACIAVIQRFKYNHLREALGVLRLLFRSRTTGGLVYIWVGAVYLSTREVGDDTGQWGALRDSAANGYETHLP